MCNQSLMLFLTYGAGQQVANFINILAISITSHNKSKIRMILPLEAFQPVSVVMK